LRKFTDFHLSSFHLTDKLILDIDGRKAWIFHGDVFDLSVQHSKWIAKLGGKSYDYIILLNRFINNILKALGKEKVSLSKKIKNSVKKAVKFVDDFEKTAVEHAIEQNYDYVICGHIHQPKQKTFIDKNGKSVEYLNSGDWIENLSSLELKNGKWKVHHYNEIDYIANPDLKIESKEINLHHLIQKKVLSKKDIPFVLNSLF